MLVAAGFAGLEVGDPVDVFAGASGETNARTFQTFGFTFRAIKTREFRVEDNLAVCAI